MYAPSLECNDTVFNEFYNQFRAWPKDKLYTLLYIPLFHLAGRISLKFFLVTVFVQGLGLMITLVAPVFNISVSIVLQFLN